MQRAFAALEPKLRGSITEHDILFTLEGYQHELAHLWIGTPDNPGVITKLVLAGMAAGNRAIEKGKAPNPVKADVGVTVDWSLLNKQALEFAQNYTYDLIRGLDSTTRADVQNALSQWVQTGAPLAELESSLRAIFNNADRAAVIAQTESTRAYNEGAKQRWQQVGVKRATWQTVNVGLKRTDKHPGDVCLICTELHGQEFDLEQGAWSDVLGQYVQAPAHVGCRCFARPLTDSIETPPEPAVEPPQPIATPTGYLPPDTGKLEATLQSLQQFLNKSDGPLATALRDPEMGLTQLDWNTDQWAVDPIRTKQAARQFVVESQNIQYGRDYLVSLAQQEAASNGVDVSEDEAETLYNRFYATRAEAILKACEIGDVPLTEAQRRRLETAVNGEYLDMVYTTDSSQAGSLANATRRKVTYGGNVYASEGARREARREFLDRMGYLNADVA